MYCLSSPRNPKHVATFSHLFGRLSALLGIRVEIRGLSKSEKYPNAIYISNHQNNYDMVTVSKIVRSPTVTVGKSSLVFIPLFGLLYWLTGNILINRVNRVKAHETIQKLVKELKRKNISFLMFPEGTRGRSKGMLPFKNGAFRAAILAGVPIFPIVVSNTHQKIELNRLHNGLVIVEMLPKIETLSLSNKDVRKLSELCRKNMEMKQKELDLEVSRRKVY
jgi:1-acyl-sn-glycerol-3-phosphate acyltransferase